MKVKILTLTKQRQKYKQVTVDTKLEKEILNPRFISQKTYIIIVIPNQIELTNLIIVTNNKSYVY